MATIFRLIFLALVVLAFVVPATIEVGREHGVLGLSVIFTPGRLSTENVLEVLTPALALEASLSLSMLFFILGRFGMTPSVYRPNLLAFFIALIGFMVSLYYTFLSNMAGTATSLPSLYVIIFMLVLALAVIMLTMDQIVIVLSKVSGSDASSSMPTTMPSGQLLSDFVLSVSAFTESKAKLLGLTRKDIYIRGQDFTIKFGFTNPMQKRFVGGKFHATIDFPSEQQEALSIDVPPLEPGGKWETEWFPSITALAEGNALVHPQSMSIAPGIADEIRPDHNPVTTAFVDERGLPVRAIHRIHIELGRDYYTYYAMRS